MKALLYSATLALLAIPSAAHAQEEGEVQTRFYDFGDMLIDGEFQRPQGTFDTARGRAQFNSLLNIRRSFVEEVEASAHEDVLE